MKTNNKILLVSVNQFIAPYPVYPIGLSYLSTYIKNKLPEFNIKIFDFNLGNMTDFENILADFKPSVVGVSLRNIDDTNSLLRIEFIPKYKNITDRIKNITNSIVVIGGSGFSIFPKLIFESLLPDYGIHGEGEESFCKLLIALQNNEPTENICGLVYSKNGTTVINERENILQSLDVSLAEDLIDYYWENSGMVGIQTKRGCPYDCIYCTYPIIEGKDVRVLDPDKIVFTMSELYQKKSVDYFFFTDAVFNINNHENIELAEKIIDSGVKIKWGAYFSPSNLTEEILELYKKAGLTHIEFGTESFSDSQLKNYHKKFTFDEVERVARITRKLNIYAAHFLILGGYGETEDTLKETFENCKRIESSVFFPFVGMRIYPGTILHELAIRDNVISEKNELLEVEYFISDKIDQSRIKENALNTGKRWVFPDEDLSEIIAKMRKKKKKGPLWEYLIS